MTGTVSSSLRTRLAFLCCGTLGFLLYSACSLLLVRTGALQAEAAAFVAVLLAIVPTFLLQKHVAFRHRGDTLGSFARYCALQAFNACAIAALTWAGRRYGVPDTANVIVSGAIVVAVSWVVISGVVFRQRPRHA